MRHSSNEIYKVEGCITVLGSRKASEVPREVSMKPRSVHNSV